MDLDTGRSLGSKFAQPEFIGSLVLVQQLDAQGLRRRIDTLSGRCTGDNIKWTKSESRRTPSAPMAHRYAPFPRLGGPRALSGTYTMVANSFCAKPATLKSV